MHVLRGKQHLADVVLEHLAPMAVRLIVQALVAASTQPSAAQAAGGALDHCRATTATPPALLLLYGCPGLLKLVAKVLHHLLQLKLVLCLRWLCPAPRGALLTLMYPCGQACPHQCCPAAGHIMVHS